MKYSRMMHFPFLFDSFISHMHGLFCSNVVKGIKCTVVQEIHFAIFSALMTENSIFPSCTPHFLQTITYAHFPLSKLSFSNSRTLSLSLRKKWKSKKKKARAPAEEWCEDLFLLCTMSYVPSFLLLLGRSQDSLSVGKKGLAFPGVRSHSCLNTWLATEKRTFSLQTFMWLVQK